MDELMKKMLDLSKSLRREIEIGEILEELRIKLMEAKTDDDLNEIIVNHLHLFRQNTKLYTHVASAKKRIDAVNKMTHKLWNNLN